MPGPCSTTPSATCRIERRRSIAVFWIQRNASGSVRLSCSHSRLLARSTALRVSSRSVRPATSASSSADLGVPGGRQLDRGDQVGLGERLDEVGHRAGVAGGLDELPLAERREHHDGGEPLAGDLLRAASPSSTGILTSSIIRSGGQLAAEVDGLRPVTGLADDVVPLLGEHLHEVHAG